MDIQEYIKPELLIMVPVLYGTGMMIKNTETIADKWIPAILGIMGILLAALYVLATEGGSLMGAFIGITQGILAASAAVYINQLGKQSKKED